MLFGQQVLDAVRDLSGIEVLVLFGSRARGTARPDSDVDVAVLTRSQVPDERRALHNRIAVALCDLAPEGRVDVVFIDEAPDFIRQEIMASGTVLWCNDQELWKAWRVRTMREFGDREHVRRQFIEAQKQRLLQGGISGRPPQALDSLERTGKLSR